MERLRLWIQTIALLGIAIAAVTYTVHDAMPTATASDGPECKYFESDKSVYMKAIDDISLQATAFLATQAGKQHVVAFPFGRLYSGTGNITSVVCAW